MSPIIGVSDVVQIPRLGKIRLGIKVAGDEDKAGYPKAVDYFVCPDEVKKVFGDKPKELAIMFPVEDENRFCQQWLRCYSLTQGLVCIGNGETARAKVDIETGEIACHTTKQWEWNGDLPCNPGECPEYLKKHCRRVMNLQFILSSVPGLGVYQIDTTSFYSIVNINSMIRLLKGLFGRCSMLPLTLAIGPIEVSPLGIKKKTVYILHIRQDNICLADMAKLALLPVGRVLVPEPEAEEPPDDLFPAGVLAEAAKVTPPAVEPSAAGEEKKPPPATPKGKPKGKPDLKALPSGTNGKEKPGEGKVVDPSERKIVDPNATQEEKHEIVTLMREQGKSNEQITNIFVSVTGKKGGWLHSDIQKLRDSLKKPPQKSVEEEADAFMKELGLTP